MQLSWEVRRGDTKQQVVSGVKFYNDPSGNGVQIEHRSPSLYYVDNYVVRCTVTLSLDSQVGEIWSGEETVVTEDFMDRHRKYVRWGPHPVHIKDPVTPPGGGTNWWTHIRRSRIHRTAIGARCRMVKLAAQRKKGPVLNYFDTLPFAWGEFGTYRKALCEYCFFGGPDKHVAFPEEDWF